MKNNEKKQEEKRMKTMKKRMVSVMVSVALLASAYGMNPSPKVQGTGLTSSNIKTIAEMQSGGLGAAVQGGLNANALNYWNGEAYENLQAAKGTDDETIDRSGVTKADDAANFARVYFGGNEYYIVNAAPGNKLITADGSDASNVGKISTGDPEDDQTVANVVTLAAAKNYGESVFNSTDTEYSEDSTKYNSDNCLVSNYFESESDSSGLYKSFFEGGRELEWSLVAEKEITIGTYYDYGAGNLNESDVTEVTKKFYAMGGYYNGNGNRTSGIKYAVAGKEETTEDGFAVDCRLFDQDTWLRS